MAMFTSHHTGHHTPKSHSTLSAAWGLVTDGIAEVRASWKRRKTAEMLEGLSPELRKDIGWPTSDVLEERAGNTHH
ncbi:hypothetical protein GAO09_14725 [Rhizobiales bacterium RZME27]|jgi:hypothetical protein|uniref:DUF1127 domain-containing protein n=1 Tax=Endobacterium cereale TaxID=2663029 RepID=A0A6A8AC47_9HYPH|nr:hypothetical protein [Endobacterium cereale]MEB2843332.1 hypothetical protein [Endobacterium cereale]MQY47290.1 hypothetical protein [Endobacterium cereale]